MKFRPCNEGGKRDVERPIGLKDASWAEETCERLST